MRTSFLIFVLATSFAVSAQQVNTTQTPKKNPPAPRSDDAQSSGSESSSKDTRIDLSPPMGDAKSHPNGGIADEVMEMHPYNPMKAMKDVEVGDYYFKEKNYTAAISRYREALEFKPMDAVATISLARALDKTKDFSAAREQYESYLKVLPSGPAAPEAKKALERIGKTAPAAMPAQAPPSN